MSAQREQVAAVLGAVALRHPRGYLWLGRRGRPLPAALRGALDAPARREYLVACLREELYWSFYCRGGVVPARWGQPGPASAHAPLVRAIAAANAGRGGREPGWTVERVDGERAVVTSARLRARVALDDCRAAGGPIAPGSAVSLPAPVEPSGLSPGFLTLAGDAGDEVAAAVVRVYWHVTCAGAPRLVRALSGRLNALAVPFRLKVADHPLRFDRCDAGVLYLRAGDFPALRAPLASLAAELAPVLRPAVPAFTLALAPGAGLAEDDGAGESFGLRRCGLLAEAIVEAHERGARGGARLAVVAERFARAEVEIDAPYREPTLAGRHVL